MIIIMIPMESFYWNRLENFAQVLVSVATAILPSACCVAAMEHGKRRSKMWLYLTLKKPSKTVNHHRNFRNRIENFLLSVK